MKYSSEQVSFIAHLHFLIATSVACEFPLTPAQVNSCSRLNDSYFLACHCG